MAASAVTLQSAEGSAQAVALAGVGMVFQSTGGPVEALRRVDLSIGSGEFVSLVGPSGCGKSTLLKIIAGLVEASAGEVSVGGRPVTRPQTEIGFVFQSPVLLDWRTVLGNIMLQIEARSLPRRAFEDRARELLAKVGLADFADAHPYELSGGMSQRVSVCRALIHDPPLLLMDEPFGALDALTRDQMMIDLQRLWLGTRKTVLFVTHNVPEAIFLSDRVAIMSPRPGRIRQILEVDLARPRRLAARTSAAFGGYVDEILRTFESMGVIREDEEDEPGEAGGDAGAPPGGGRGRPEARVAP
jgi:NitT/TauT family transport system ATP-binding protein